MGVSPRVFAGFLIYLPYLTYLPGECSLPRRLCPPISSLRHPILPKADVHDSGMKSRRYAAPDATWVESIRSFPWRGFQYNELAAPANANHILFIFPPSPGREPPANAPSPLLPSGRKPLVPPIRRREEEGSPVPHQVLIVGQLSTWFANMRSVLQALVFPCSPFNAVRPQTEIHACGPAGSVSWSQSVSHLVIHRVVNEHGQRPMGGRSEVREYVRVLRTYMNPSLGQVGLGSHGNAFLYGGP